ncbi:cysteine-rich PDZ-binding protein [Culicoides brevitarsis]|uniref:cysteine-rich PDZ-binding protein n=1 Tax=Culicoides brevitarsis TaxID=469753 RepID=UPI00307B9F69
MVCDKCEAKLAKIVTPDPWKSGARNTTEGGRKINENKALTSSKERFNPIGELRPCRICRSKTHQKGAYYCQACAYKKGICAMCGKKILNTKGYRQSST